MKETLNVGKKKIAAQELTFGKVITSNESHIALIGSDGSSTYNIAHKGLSLKIKYAFSFSEPAHIYSSWEFDIHVL